VYDPEKPITEAAADKLLRDGRARLAAGGDYQEGSELDTLAADILAEMARGVTSNLFA
jgi:hypothetical protein